MAKNYTNIVQPSEPNVKFRSVSSGLSKDFVSLVSVFFRINQSNWFELVEASLLAVDIEMAWSRKAGHSFHYSQN